MPYESACPPYAHSAAQARAAIDRAHTNLAHGSELGVTKVTAPAKVSDTTGTTPGGCSILADRSGAAVRAQPACRARPAARPPARLEEDEAHLVGLDVGAPPVVHVVLEVAVADAELELLQKGFIVENVEGIKYVELQPLRKDERIGH